MMRRSILACAAAGFLQACGTFHYVPEEYPLRDGLIPAIGLSGDVRILNAQPSEQSVVVYEYAGSNLSSNYHVITEQMVKQARKELAKAADPAGQGEPKTIALTVRYMRSRNRGFHYASELHYTANLGGEDVIERQVTHASGIRRQDMNGLIAEAVLDLLTDKDVRTYLAS